MYKHPIAFLSVNNLTVARYAAAMMVDYVGFCLDTGGEKAITVGKAREIMGWLSGVKFIGEFHTRPADEITAIAMELNLEMVILYGDYTEAEMVSIPFPKISSVKQPGTDYVLDEEFIKNGDGAIVAIPIYSESEDETGILNFDAITDKLNTLEL